ncbi:MAG: ABC transporter substrate-binding protein [Chloroflexota bacterium]
MRRLRVFVVSAILAMLALLLMVTAACQQAGPSSSSGAAPKEAPKGETVNIGLWVALTGSQVDLGTMSRNGAQMAVDDVNAQGGIKALGGAKLNLVVADVTSDAAQVPTVIERSLSQTKIAGAVGCGASQFTLSALPVMEKRGVPMVTSSISDDITKQGYKNIFQIAPKGSMFGAMQVEFLSFLKKKYSIPVEKVGFIYENTAYGTSTAGGLRKIAEQQGYKIVIDQSYPAGFSDAAPLVTAVRSAGAEVVFPVSYTVDGTLIVTTMHQMNYLPVMIGGGAAFIWPDIQKSLGDKVNGIFSVGSWSWDSKNITSDTQKVDVTKRYKEKFGTYMPEQAGEHYAAVWVLKEGLEAAASSDPAKVRDALSKIKITAGPATMMQPGVVEFDETGMSRQVFPTMIQWQKGEPRTVYPEQAQNVEVAWPIR